MPAIVSYAQIIQQSVVVVAPDVACTITINHVILKMSPCKDFHVPNTVFGLANHFPIVAHTEMLLYPSLVLDGIPGLRVTNRMKDYLLDLGDEAIGPQNRWSSSSQYLLVILPVIHLIGKPLWISI